MHTRAVAVEALWKAPHSSLGFLKAVFPDMSKVGCSDYRMCLTDTYYSDVCCQLKPSDLPSLEALLPAGSSPLLRSMPLIPEDWISSTEFGAGTGTVAIDFTRTEFLSCPSIERILVGPFAKPESKEMILKEKQATERLMALYCILVECESIW